jgi:flagellar basal-body rod modification protein FlgD
MASSISPLMQAGTTPPPAGQTPADPTSKLANEQTFLQLLVAQIKNQNPLSPTDGVQFVSQLAQFSQLEQTIAVRQDADAIRGQLVPPATTPAPGQTQS